MGAPEEVVLVCIDGAVVKHPLHHLSNDSATRAMSSA